MNFRKEQLLELIAQIAPNRYLQALLIIILFYGLAKALDFIIVRVIKRWTEKTKFTVDDQILDIFHRPIFVSVMLFGLALSTERLELPGTFNFLTLATLKTMAIFIWAMALTRFVKLLLRLVSNDESRFAIIQERTLPLFNHFSMILMAGLAIYFVFLAWNIDVTALSLIHI